MGSPFKLLLYLICVLTDFAAFVVVFAVSRGLAEAGAADRRRVAGAGGRGGGERVEHDLRHRIVMRQMCDAYQWALLISTHEQRHILQIREVKADARYPGK